MSVHFVSGDLFANRHNCQAFAHGVNCLGVMGKGIAKEFKLRFPEMFAKYQSDCQCLKAGLRWPFPGVCTLHRESKPQVFNLFTQGGFGPCASYGALESALLSMSYLANDPKDPIVSIAMPAIGCGIGGLELKKVKSIISDLFESWHGHIFFYERYETESKPEYGIDDMGEGYSGSPRFPYGLG